MISKSHPIFKCLTSPTTIQGVVESTHTGSAAPAGAWVSIKAKGSKKMSKAL